MVPSSEALAPLPPLGVPLLWSTGQAATQAPLQADWFGWSFSNKYSVRPLPSTRTIPSLLLAALTMATPEDPLPTGLAAPPEPPEPEPGPLLPHPAASAPAAASTTSVISGRRSPLTRPARHPDRARLSGAVLLVPVQMRMCILLVRGRPLAAMPIWRWAS